MWGSTALLTGYSVSEALRLLLVLCFLASLFLAAWRITTAMKERSVGRATGSIAIRPKSGISSNKPDTPPSTPIGIDKPKPGTARIAAQAVPIFCLAVMIAASISIPLERAVSADQIVTARNLYLPHVAEELDAYHFWAINPVGDRMLLQFCPDHGIKPPFDEGETITWLRYRRVGDCLELLGADAIRDGNNKVTRR